MMKFILGLVLGIVLVPLLADFYVRLGYAPIAAAAAPFPFERTPANMALDATIAKNAPKQPGVPADEKRPAAVQNYLAKPLPAK